MLENRLFGSIVYLAGDSYACGDGMERDLGTYLSEKLGFEFVSQSDLLPTKTKSRVELGNLIPERVDILKKRIETLTEPVILVGRSSGARVASLCSDSSKVVAVVCLAYPFKHPNKYPEITRYGHLKSTVKPTLIVQGVRDEYGGLVAVKQYKISNKVEFFYIDAKHSMVMSASLLNLIQMRILRFLNAECRLSCVK